MLLKSNKSIKSGHGRLFLNSKITHSTCMQFWFVIPDNLDSSLEILIDTVSGTKRLWENSKGTYKDWSFGQVDIPGISPGKVCFS
jgi:hypothetical protein